MKVLTLTRAGFEHLAQQYEVRALAELAEAARAAANFDIRGYQSHMARAELETRQAVDIRKLCESIHGRTA